MKIGIIGVGVVGGAVKHGFERLGHQVIGHDIKFSDSKIEHIIPTEISFICVPTPQTASGACDVSYVVGVIRELEEQNYTGVVVIKSTVTPGTTERLSKMTKLRLAFCPEFLRERAAITDFAENHDVCVIGTEDEEIYKMVVEAHGRYPKKFVRLTPTEAEFTKYFSNVFNALRITFANEFFEVCRTAGVNYNNIKTAMVNRDTIMDVYLDCNENLRGFGGVCLPKDTSAFAHYVESLGLDLKLFQLIVEENKKFKRTVLDGMRDFDPTTDANPL